MITITGEHNDAVVYAENVDENCRNQIKQYLDHPLFAGTKVRIMPDVHFGKGSVVGFTATCNEYVVPSIVGVDIGCGVNAHDLGRGHVPFDKLDRYVRQNIPSGFEVNASISDVLEEVYGRMFGNGIVLDEFKERVSALSEKVSVPVDRAFASLGTLGGGNHFIEIDTDANGGRWLLIHSGSRGFGARIAEYHQKIASRRTGDDSPIKFLFGVTANEYVDDMRTAQLYARVNRALMAFQIACGFFKIAHDKFKEKAIESVHNYIDFEHGIIRKGAISAQTGERLVIPFSMADGAIIGIGKGNGEWNCSAPHGSGRKLSRSLAKELSIDEYRKRMANVWSSCVTKATIDESPMAYKRTSDILGAIENTVQITNRLIPVYNFKAQ